MRAAPSAIAGLAIALACLAGMHPVVAAAASGGHAGSLDRSFGDEGVVTADFGTEGTSGGALAVVADESRRLLVLEPGKRGIAVARYWPDGHLDPSFGDGGIALNRFGTCNEGSIGLGPAGTVVASCRGAIARFTESGEIDTGFGREGVIPVESLVQRQRDSWEVNLAQTVTQEDGGTIAMYATGAGATAVRFDASGRLDSSYGEDGRVTVQGSEFKHEPFCLLALPDGKILFAATGLVNTLYGLIVGRLEADGRPDPTFGTGGFLEMRGLGEGPFGIARLPDGSFYVGGFNNRFIHVSANGVWDRAFGDNGIAFGPARLGTVRAIAATPDGGLLAAGALSRDPYGAARLLLERLTADGDPAPGFGPHGFVTARPEPGRHHEARDLIELPDGGIVLVGSAGHNRLDLDASQVALAAFRPDGLLDRAFGEEGTVLMPAISASTDSVAALTVDERGRTVVAGRAAGGSAVVRFGRGGARDATFGRDGLVRLPEVGYPRNVTGTAIAPSAAGRLLVAIGSSGGGGVFRLGLRGHVDRSFGLDGLAGGRLFSWATDLLPTAEGGFLVAGSLRDESIVSRFGRSGRLEAGYGRKGTIHTGVGERVRLARSPNGRLAVLRGREPAEYGPRGHRIKAFAPAVHSPSFRRLLPIRVYDLAFDRHGRLLLVGTRHGRVAISRLFPDGRPDPSFGAGGLLLTSAGTYAAGERIAVEADGTIVVAGLARPCRVGERCQRGKVIVLRYSQDGALDRSFGERGRFVDPLHQVVAVTALALRPGSITIGGTAEPGVEDRQFYLARLNR